MYIAILQFELLIDMATGLKDKRRVIKSLKDRLHREHMVSVAEIGALETWNLAILGLVACNRDAALLRSSIDGLIGKLQQLPEARLGSYVSDVIPVAQLQADSTSEDGTPLWTEDERRDAST